MPDITMLFCLALDLLNDNISLNEFTDVYSFNRIFTNDKIETNNKTFNVKIVKNNNMFISYYEENDEQNIAQINILTDENYALVNEICDYFSLKKKCTYLIGKNRILLVPKKIDSRFDSIILIAEYFDNNADINFIFIPKVCDQKQKISYIKNGGVLYDNCIGKPGNAST
jgi:hypothetical protein